MFKSIVKPLRNSRGMTLVEIMIVLAIIGGLMAILAPKVAANFNKAKVRQAKLQISELGKALDMYYTDCGQYPSTEQGFNALMTAPSGEPPCPNWGPEPYVKKNLIKDPWNRDFLYELSGSSYVIRSLGKDGREGGTGIDADISSADEDAGSAKEKE